MSHDGDDAAMRTLIGLFAFVLVSAPASAQERYSPWAGGDPSVSADRGRLQGFVDRLNALVDEGEKADQGAAGKTRRTAARCGAGQQTRLWMIRRRGVW